MANNMEDELPQSSQSKRVYSSSMCTYYILVNIFVKFYSWHKEMI